MSTMIKRLTYNSITTGNKLFLIFVHLSIRNFIMKIVNLYQNLLMDWDFAVGLKVITKPKVI